MLPNVQCMQMESKGLDDDEQRIEKFFRNAFPAVLREAFAHES